MITGTEKELDDSMRNLKKHLERYAPVGETGGISPSRRIEGQFVHGRESNFFPMVTFLVQPGVDQCPELLKGVVQTVLRFQYEGLRGDSYPVVIRWFPCDGEPIHMPHVRGPGDLKKVMENLMNHAGLAPCAESQSLDGMGQIHRDALVVVVSMSRDLKVSPEVAEKLTGRKNKVVWILPEEEVFLTKVTFGEATGKTGDTDQCVVDNESDNKEGGLS